MKTKASMVVVLLFWGMVISLLSDGAPGQTNGPERIQTLIKQLGHKDYTVREEASRALTQMGPAALTKEEIGQLTEWIR